MEEGKVSPPINDQVRSVDPPFRDERVRLDPELFGATKRVVRREYLDVAGDKHPLHRDPLRWRGPRGVGSAGRGHSERLHDDRIQVRQRGKIMVCELAGDRLSERGSELLEHFLHGARCFDEVREGARQC